MYSLPRKPTIKYIPDALATKLKLYDCFCAIAITKINYRGVIPVLKNPSCTSIISGGASFTPLPNLSVTFFFPIFTSPKTIHHQPKIPGSGRNWGSHSRKLPSREYLWLSDAIIFTFHRDWIKSGNISV